MRPALIVARFGMFLTLSVALVAYNSPGGIVRLLPSAINLRPVEIVDQLGGASFAVGLKDTLALLGVGTRVLVFDVSRPTSPRLLGWTRPMQNIIQSIDLMNNYAVVAASPSASLINDKSTSSLNIIDLSDPTMLQETASLEFPDGIVDVDLSGNLVYLAFGRGGLRIVDIQDPSRPIVVGELEVEGGVYSVSVVGGVAFAASLQSRFQVIDVSLSASPRIVGGMTMSGMIENITTVPDWVFVLRGGRDLGTSLIDIVDARNPMQSIISHSMTIGFHVDVIRAIGDHLYVVGNGQVQIYDVAVRSSPQIVAGGSWSGLAHDIAVDEDVVVVAAEIGVTEGGETVPAGLRILSFRSGTLLAAGKFATIRWVGPVALAEEQVIFGARVGNRMFQELVKRKIEDLMEPDVDVSNTDVGLIWEIKTTDRFAYVANWNVDAPFAGGGLRIFDIGSPLGPTLVGSLDTELAATAVAVLGNYAYLGGGKGLEIVDVSNREHPVSIGHLPLTLASRSLDVEAIADIVYLTFSEQSDLNDRGTLLIVDVSSPSRPSVLRSESLTMRPRSMTIAQNALYVAGSRGLRVFDISSISKPVPAGSLDAPLRTYELVVDEDIGYAIVDSDAVQSRALAIFDLSRPSTPRLLSTEYIATDPVSICVGNDSVFVGAGDAGLFVTKKYVGVTATPSVLPPPIVFHSYLPLLNLPLGID